MTKGPRSMADRPLGNENHSSLFGASEKLAALMLLKFAQQSAERSLKKREMKRSLCVTTMGHVSNLFGGQPAGGRRASNVHTCV